MKNTNSTQIHTDLLSGKSKSLFEKSETSSRNLKISDFQLNWGHCLKLKVNYKLFAFFAKIFAYFALKINIKPQRIIRVNLLNPSNPCCYICENLLNLCHLCSQKSKIK